MIVEGPGIFLTGEQASRLLHGRADRQLLADLQRVAVRWELEETFLSSLRPAAEVAVELGISATAMRHRLRRRSWPGQMLDGRWHAVPPSSPLAPPSRP